MDRFGKVLRVIVLLVIFLVFQGSPVAASVPAQTANPPAGAVPGAVYPMAGSDHSPRGIDTASGRVLPLSITAQTLTGGQNAAVIRVYFHNYANTSRYTKAQVQGFFDTEVNNMWNRISYGNITISAKVSDIYQLPHDRSSYVTDHSDGDLSDGDQYMNVLNDAVAAALAHGYDFTGAKFVMVLMAETDAAQYHRGQANQCSLGIGPTVTYFGITFHQPRTVGCAVFSENPADPDERVWGRWMHEMGHTFQAAGPAHPSNYNNSFELMDRLYPGHSGMFEKQSSVAFPGWISPSVYLVLPAGKSGSADLWAEEYQPADLPNGGMRAIRAEVSPSVYYIISVRGTFQGDEVRPISDQGVLIERVVEGADPWVTVQAAPGGASALWHVGQNFSNASDGMYINVVAQPDANKQAYTVQVRRDVAPRPDLMVRSWLSAPLDTWETSDIWVDSSCNGYGTFMYGAYVPGGDSTTVGYGNGDSPCANHHNRLYARIRNIGNGTATNVVAHFQVTNPMGVGMNGATWTDIGTVTQSDPGGAGLASLPGNSYTDIFVDWIPSITLTPEQMAAGGFNFHTCVRVIIDSVPGELNPDNQDGVDEQENIDTFFFQPSPTISEQIVTYNLQVRNNDPVNPRLFNISYETNLPPGWEYIVNDNKSTITISGGGLGLVPVKVRRVGAAAAGQNYTIKVRASYLSQLQPIPPAIDPYNKLPDIHIEDHQYSGATIAVLVADPTRLQLRAARDSKGGIQITGTLAPAPPNRETPINLDLLDAKGNILTSLVVVASSTGQFSTYISPTNDFARTTLYVDAIYQGTMNLAVKDTVFQSGAFTHTLVASAYNYLPTIFR